MDNVATRKVALLICNYTYSKLHDAEGFQVGKVFEARHKTSMMDKFLRECLSFDSVKTHVDIDLAGLDTALNTLQAVEVEPWLANQHRKGTLLIFVYFMGFWVKTSGSQIYSVLGEKMNLD